MARDLVPRRDEKKKQNGASIDFLSSERLRSVSCCMALYDKGEFVLDVLDSAFSLET